MASNRRRNAARKRVFEKSWFHQSIEHEAECDWVDYPGRLDSALVIVATVGTFQTPSHVQLSRSDERASHPGPQDHGSSGGALIKDRLTEDQPSILFQVGSFAVNNPLLRKLTIWPPAPL